MSEMDDWLNPEAQQKKQLDLAIEEAQIYLLFANDERGRELLRRWDERLMNQRTPVDASLQRYAADEAVRAFVAGIHKQIKLAGTRSG